MVALALAVYYPNDSDEFITCQDYLDFRDIDEIDWLPDIHDSTIVLHSQGREWIASKGNQGRLDWIVPQFKAAAHRLSQGKPALVRSAICDSYGISLFLFEPASQFGDDDARISDLVEPRNEIFGYPIPYIMNPNDPAALYQRVASDRDQLVNPKFDRIPFPETELIHALEREIDLGQRLLDLLGVPDPADIWLMNKR